MKENKDTMKCPLRELYTFLYFFLPLKITSKQTNQAITQRAIRERIKINKG